MKGRGAEAGGQGVPHLGSLYSASVTGERRDVWDECRPEELPAGKDNVGPGIAQLVLLLLLL